MFSHLVSYDVGMFRHTRARFRPGIDLIAKAQLDLDGQWTLVGGIPIDPTRF